MAEFVGVSVSLATVGCLTSSLDSVAKAAYRAARHRNELKEEVLYFSSTLRSRSDGFDLMFETLAELEAMPDSDASSDIFQFLASRDVLEDIAGQATYLTKEMEKLKPIFNELKSNGSLTSSVVSGFKWVLTFKAQLTELIGKTAWLKSNIEPIYYCFLVKRNILDRARTKDPILLRRLEIDNKSCRLRLKQLERQFKQHMEQHQSSHYADPTDNRTSPSPRTVDSLMELTASMRDHERVPPVSPSSSTSSSFSWPSYASTSDSGQRYFSGGSRRTATSTTRSPRPGETFFSSVGDGILRSSEEATESRYSLTLRSPTGNLDSDSRVRKNLRRECRPVSTPSLDEHITYKDISSNEDRGFDVHDGSFEDRGGEVLSLTLPLCLTSETWITTSVPAAFCRTSPYSFMSFGMTIKYRIEVFPMEQSVLDRSFILPESRRHVMGVTKPIRVRNSERGLRGSFLVEFIVTDTHQSYVIVGPEFLSKYQGGLETT